MGFAFAGFSLSNVIVVWRFDNSEVWDQNFSSAWNQAETIDLSCVIDALDCEYEIGFALIMKQITHDTDFTVFNVDHFFQFFV
jgi:hypothetical protein